MNVYFAVILVLLIGKFFLIFIVEVLNLSNLSNRVPEEFRGFYDEEKYSFSQNYLKENTIFYLIKEAVFTALIVFFIIAGGFNSIDVFVRGFKLPEVVTGLLFAIVILLAYELVSIPFSAYKTFVIEKKYGFNRTDLKTFILDIIKSLILCIIIGGIIFALIMWLFIKLGKPAWIYCWFVVIIFELFLVFLSPIIILPLFNKFVPLQEPELREAIFRYANSQNFPIMGIFKMDASRRTAKTNAYFVGFGRFRRICLFDTLIQNHTKEELVSILAHEIGHFKKRHILKNLAFSILENGLMFFILSNFINNRYLFDAFKVQRLSIYGSLFFFGFLYSPISLIFSIIQNMLSRKFEFEADKFVAETYKDSEAFISALKKLTVDNLTNLTPHPLKVFLDYTHPPVLDRIERIKEISQFSINKKDLC